MSTPCDRFEPMLSALLDGELSSDDASEVRGHLDDCESCRGEFEELRSAAGLIATGAPTFRIRPWSEIAPASREQAPAKPAEFVPTKSRKARALDRRVSRGTPWTRYAAAAAVVLAAAAVYMTSFRGGEPRATVAWTEGDLYAVAGGDESPLDAERGPLAPEAVLRTGQGRSELALPGGVAIEMNSGSRVRLAGVDGRGLARRIYLESGQATARVPEGYGSFKMVYPSGLVAVTGTEFDVRLEGSSRAEVTTFRGSVKVSGGGRTVDLVAGMSVVARRGDGPGEPVKVSLLERSAWRRSDRRQELATSMLDRPYFVESVPEGQRRVLVDFEDPDDIKYFGDSTVPERFASRSDAFRLDGPRRVQGRGALEFPADVGLSSLEYASVKGLPKDWTGWRWMRFEVFNPTQSPVPSIIALKDRGHADAGDRYNRVYVLDPGWNRIEVDLADVAAGRIDGRKGEYGKGIDLSNMHHMTYGLPESAMAELGGVKFALDFIRLEGRLE